MDPYRDGIVNLDDDSDDVESVTPRVENDKHDHPNSSKLKLPQGGLITGFVNPNPSNIFSPAKSSRYAHSYSSVAPSIERTATNTTHSSLAGFGHNNRHNTDRSICSASSIPLSIPTDKSKKLKDNLSPPPGFGYEDTLKGLTSLTITKTSSKMGLDNISLSSVDTNTSMAVSQLTHDRRSHESMLQLPTPLSSVAQPRAKLAAWYGQSPRRQLISKDAYLAWHDGGQPHNMRYTAIFVCPRTKEVFPSGRYGDHNLYEERLNNGGGTSIWYKKKNMAEHGAAARAYDCLTLREYHDKRGSSIDPPARIGDDEPYLEKRKPPRNLPGNIRIKLGISEQQEEPTSNTANQVTNIRFQPEETTSSIHTHTASIIDNVPKSEFRMRQEVIYTNYQNERQKAKIIEVHWEADDGEYFYTIKFHNSGRRTQTDASSLKPAVPYSSKLSF